jgi:hypothetical protein
MTQHVSANCDGQDARGGKRKLEYLRIPRPSASAAEYRARARQIRQLAETIANPEEEDLLLDIAEKYERLAEAAARS